MPIVEAVGVATSVANTGLKSDVIQRAMVAAIEKAQADGVTDPDEMRALMLAARDAMIDQD